MTKSLSSTLAAAVIASAAFGSAALASGNYYPGVSSEPVTTIDSFQTSSVGDRYQAPVQVAGQTADHGDYYQGVNRPQ